MKVITLIALLFVLFLGVGYGVYCATGDEPADMNAKIIGVCSADPQNNSANCNSILVEGKMVGTDQNINVSVKLSPQTVIMEKNGKNYSNTTFTSLKPGQSVDLIFTGPILQSYPPQTTASEIIIIR